VPRPDAGGSPTPEHTSDISGLLACIASPVRLGILAALARQPRALEALCAIFKLEYEDAREHLRQLGACGLVQVERQQGEAYAVTPRVQVEHAGWQLHLHLASTEGATVQAQLPLDTPTGRLLARAWDAPVSAEGP
jgi:DNA-binding transcriptional ArsR family regulator